MLSSLQEELSSTSRQSGYAIPKPYSTKSEGQLKGHIGKGCQRLSITSEGKCLIPEGGKSCESSEKSNKQKTTRLRVQHLSGLSQTTEEPDE